MKDQVDRLRDQGFGMSVDYLNADRASYEETQVLEGLLDGRIVLLYVAPERLRDPVFRNVLERRIAADRGLERLVLDEAYCLNQWGFEFRPDYFFAMRSVLGQAFELSSPESPDGLGDPEKTSALRAPVLMLSATHTAADRDALAAVLNAARSGRRVVPLTPVPDPSRQQHPLREHIEVSTERVQSAILGRKEFQKGLPDRMPHVEGMVREAMENAKRTGQRSGVLIFVTRRTHAEAVAAQIANSTGARSESFHAGLSADLRTELVDEFKEGHIDVLVATKAFGMGSDDVDTAVDEEARTLYVAATRAKERFMFLGGARENAWLSASPCRQEGAEGAKFLEGKGGRSGPGMDFRWSGLQQRSCGTT